MRKSLLFAGTFLSVLLLSFAFSTTSYGQATVTTDKDDYPPRSTAIFTGAGFQPFETVVLKVKNLSYPCNTVFADSSYLPFSVVADADGAFVTEWIVCECPGDSLRLKATGQISGLIAFAYFTDANINSVTLGNQTGTLTYGTGGSVTYTYTVTASNANTGTSTVTMSATLPPDISASFSNPTFSLPRNGSVSGTLTLTTTNATQVPSPNTFTITATGTETNNTLTSSAKTIVINKRSLTPAISVPDKIYDGTTNTNFVPSFTNAANIVAGDVVSFTGTVVFPSKDASPSAYTINGSAFTLTGASAGNYTLSATTASTTASITKRDVTASIVANDKVYNGSPLATLSSQTLNTASGNAGVISGDNVNLVTTAANINFADADAGTWTVTATGLTLNGTAAGNYQLTSTSATDQADITPKALTVSNITVDTKIYDKTTDATLNLSSASLTGVIGGDVVSVSPSGYTATFNSAGAGTNIAVTVSNLSLAGTDKDNYSLTQPTGLRGVISKRSITATIVANNKVYDATTLATLSSQVLNQATGSSTDGLISGDVVNLTILAANINFSNKNVGTWTVTATGLTIGGSGSSNYSLSSTSATDDADITQRPITITVTAGQKKVYGQTDPATFAYTATTSGNSPPQGLAGTDAFSGALARDAGEDVGTYPITQNTLTIKNGITDVSANYNITYSGTSFEITKRPITVTVTTGQSKVYGESDPVLAYTYTPTSTSPAQGLAYTDAFSGALTRAPGEDVNTYAISIGGLTIKNGVNDVSGNYTITFTPTTFAITKRSITIDVTPGQSKVYGQADPTFAYTYSPDPATTGAGLATGDAFTGSLSRDAGENVGSAYDISQGTLGIEKSGSDVSGNYTMTFNPSTFEITKRPITITVTASQTKVYGQTDPVLAYTYTAFSTTPAKGLAPGDSFDGELSRAAGEDVSTSYSITQGTLTIVNSSATNVIANYDVTFSGSTFSITKRPITITVTTGQEKVYGESDPVFAYTYTPTNNDPARGLATGDAISGDLSREPGEDVDTYDILQNTLTIKNGGTDVSGNYTITYTGTTFEITKRPITITVTTGQSKVYGENDPVLAYTYTASNTSPAEGLAFTDGFSGALARASGNNVNTYAITQGTLTIKNGGTDVSANYNITFTGTTFSITKRPITVDVTAGQSKVYGESDPTLAYTYSPNPAETGAGLAYSDAFSGALARDAGQNIGTTYNILQGTLTIKNGGTDVSGNYTITFNPSTFAITKRPITITVTAAQTKVYGATDPALAYTYTAFSNSPAKGLAAGDAFDGALSRSAGENVGNAYSISQGTLTIVNVSAVDMLDNYDVTFDDNTFSITKRPITITVTTGQKKVYGETDPVFAYTSTPTDDDPAEGLAFDDAFSGLLSRMPGESVNTYDILQNTLTIKNGGTDVSGNYTITYTGTTFEITKRPIAVTVTTGQSKVYGESDPVFAYTYSPNPATTSPAEGLATGDVFNGSLQRVAGIDVGTYAISIGGLKIKNGVTDVSSNYDITFTPTTFEITKRPVTINVTPGQTKVYGQSDPAFAYTFTPNPATTGAGLAYADAFSGALTRDAGEDVGNAYNILQTGLTIKNGLTDVSGNYNVTYNGTTFAITKRPITITVTAGQTKVYGQTDPAFAYTYTAYGNSPAQGLASGDAFAGALSRDGTENVGNSNILIGTLVIKKATVDVSANYNINFVGSTFSITKRPICITVTAGQYKYYSQADPSSFAYTSTTFSNAPPQGLAPGDAFSGALTRAAGEEVNTYAISIGTLTIVKSADDVSANYTITFKGTTFEIKPLAVSSSATVNPTSQQYSDLVTFSVTITGGAPKFLNGPQAAASATFKIGTQVMGSANFVVSGSDIVATLSNKALLETVAGALSPGVKTVTACIVSPNANFNISNLNPTTTLAIYREDARVEYTGTQFMTTGSVNNSSATVQLRATIQDITAVTGDPAYDANEGDIRNARVMFINAETQVALSGWLTPTLISSSNMKIGTVSKDVVLDAGTTSADYTIGVLVGYGEPGHLSDSMGYYKRNSADDEVVVTVSRPLSEFITGGGYIMPTSTEKSGGLKASDVGRKINFGFNVKYTKSSKNIQGRINVIFRRTESNGLHIYQLKTTSLTSLAVDPTKLTANVVAKGNLTDITNPLYPVSVPGCPGNMTVNFNVTDNGEPGNLDQMSLTVWDNNKLIYSSSWSGTNTLFKTLAGGNIQVRGTSYSPTSTYSTSTVDESTRFENSPPNKFVVKVLNNPTTSYFGVQVLSNTNDVVEIEVYDMAGRKVRQYRGAVGETFRVGHSLLQGMYTIQVLQGKNKSVTKVIKN